MSSIKIGPDSIQDIVKALLARAKRQFQNLQISGVLASQENMIVYRITHELAIDGKEPWIAIIKLTRVWKSDDNRIRIAVQSMKDAVEEYDYTVDQATDLCLIEPDEFLLTK